MSDYLSIDADAGQLLVLSTGDDPGITLLLGVPGPAGKDTSASITNGPGISVASANGILTITNADRGSEAVAAHVKAADPHPQYAKLNGDGDQDFAAKNITVGGFIDANAGFTTPSGVFAKGNIETLNSFIGDGSQIVGIKAGAIATGTLNAARLPTGIVFTDDSRLSDARTPTAHTQTMSTISDMTPTGRLLGGAADAAAARSAIGAGIPLAIGNTIVGSTASRVLFVGAGGVIADDSGLTYDSATDRLSVAGGVMLGGAAATAAVLGLPRVAGVRAGTSEFGFVSNNAEGFLEVSNGTVTIFGAHVNNIDGAVFGAFSNHPCTIRAANNRNRIQCLTDGRTAVGDWTQGQAPPATGFFFRPNGGIQLAQLTDAAAANNTLYFSTTTNRVVYKRADGTVRNLEVD